MLIGVALTLYPCELLDLSESVKANNFDCRAQAGPPTRTFSSRLPSINASGTPTMSQSMSQTFYAPTMRNPAKQPSINASGHPTMSQTFVAPTTFSPATSDSSSSSKRKSYRNHSMDDEISITKPFTCEMVVGPGKICGHVEIGRQSLIHHIQKEHPPTRDEDGYKFCAWIGCRYTYPLRSTKISDHVKHHILEEGCHHWRPRRNLK